MKKIICNNYYNTDKYCYFLYRNFFMTYETGDDVKTLALLIIKIINIVLTYVSFCCNLEEKLRFLIVKISFLRFER